jgi:hypothetical protein
VRRRAALTTAILTATVLAACGSDDATPAGDTAPGVNSSSVDSIVEPPPALTAADICDRLSIDSVAADTGLDLVGATADDAATPQCAYEYTNDTAGVSNLTVASMRPEDVGGRTGSDAFEFVVGINAAVAGDEAESQEVSAGDAAIRFSGPMVDLGIVQVGDSVFTLIIPGGDVEPDAVDRLLTTMATALG